MPAPRNRDAIIDGVMHRECTYCGLMFPLDRNNFAQHGFARGGFNHRCKSCTSKYNREYTRAHHPNVRRNHKLLFKYGITLEDFALVLDAQSGECAICGTSDPGPKGWTVDHDHKTGELRGILCVNCNLALGNFKDNVEVMRNAIDYIEASPGGQGYEVAGAQEGGVPSGTPLPEAGQEEAVPEEMMAALTGGE